MKTSSLPFIYAGLGIGLAAYLAFRNFRKARPLSDLHLTAADLKSPDKSPGELLSSHLLDLNTAGASELVNLGLHFEVAEHVIENRPYRNKLELMSRMILPPAIYDSIKSRIGIATLRSPLRSPLTRSAKRVCLPPKTARLLVGSLRRLLCIFCGLSSSG